MSSAIRTIVAILAGAVVAVLLVSLGDALVARLWPLPQGVDISDRDALAAALQSLPSSAFLTMVVFWAVACAAGAFVAARWSATRQLWPGLVVVVLLTASALANLALIRHPSWMWVATLLAVPAAGFFAARAGAAPAAARRAVAADAQLHA